MDSPGPSMGRGRAWSTRLAARPATRKTQPQMLRRRLGDGGWVLKTALKTSVVQSRFCKLTTLLIALVAWTHLREMQDDSVCREHLHNLSAYSLNSMIAVSGNFPPRLGIRFYIFSRLGSIRRGLTFYSISYHALAVSRGLACLVLT